MPVARDRMDGNERFRSILTNGNPKVLGTLLAELGDAEAKRIIDECYRDENDTALIQCVRKAGDGKNKKDKDLIDCCNLLLQHGADLSEFDDEGKTALHWACENRNEILVRTLMASHADPWVKDAKGRNCLQLAVTSSTVDCVNAILEECQDAKKNLNDTDKDGLCPIVAAVQKGNADILSVLIAAGANVNIQEVNTKRTPLHYALYIKRRDLFEYLLENGANITLTDHRGTNILHRCCAVGEPAFLEFVLVKHDKAQLKKALKMEDGEGATPVIVACQNGNVEQLLLLQQAEAPLTSKDKFKRCALHHCVENTNAECAELLLQWAPNLVQVVDEEGLTPLHMAVIAGNVRLIKLLLTKGANLGAVDNEKHSVTHWATVCGHTSVLNELLEAGAKLSTPDKYSAYPIHYASQMVAGSNSDSDKGNSSSGSEGGSIQILRTLLKHKVSTEVEDKDHRTPIIWAASAGNSEGCRVLKEHGADVNRADKDDLTALHCAASRGHADCVGTLIRHCKAAIDPVDKNHCTPLFYAATLGHLESIRTLLEYEADCSHRDTRGRTVAHCATVSGSTDVLDILKDYGVDLWARNSKGDQPLHEAAQSGHIDIVQYLLNQGSNNSSGSRDTHASKSDNKHQNNNRNANNNNSNNHNVSNINNSNHEGRTCLHIAALTNNVWLCNVLLEKGANVNSIMSNKGKYYTPYDAALIKGHSEAKDILRHHGGVPGTEVSNHAAATIQTKYKYHSKKKVKEDRKEKEEEEENDEKTDDCEKRDNNNVTPDETVKNENDEKKSNEDKKETDTLTENKVENKTALVVGSGKSADSGKDKAKKTPEKAKPVYVEASTQVHTVRPGVLVGDSTEDEPSEKEPSRSRPQSSKKVEQPGKLKSSPNSESEKPKPKSETGVNDNSKNSHSHDKKTKDSKSKPSPLVIKTAVEDQSTDEEEEPTSERSSHGAHSSTSHGNSSDVESLDSVIHSRNRQSSISKSKHKNLENGKAMSKETDNTTNNKNNRSTVKSVKEKQIPPQNKQESKLNKQPTEIVKENSKSTKNSTNKSVNNKQLSKESVPNSFESKESGGDRKSDNSNRTTPRDSCSDAKTPRSDQDMGGLFSKRKIAAINHADKNTSSSPRQENGEVPKKINDGYTDNDDSELEGDNQGTEMPRRKKTRPSKLISRVQESVKRYEEERRSIRRLHQVKRAQIYSAPMYDVSLFKAIMDNSQQTSQGTPTSNASTWDEYLQEQIRIIQEDRKSARRGISGRDQSCENSTPTQPPTRKGPQAPRPTDRDHHADPKASRTAPVGRGSLQGSDSLRTKSSMSKAAPGAGRQGRLERAQTANMPRTQASRSGTRKDDPLQLKHEEQQRLLRQAYRPFGTMNGLPNNQRQINSMNPRPVTAVNTKVMSTTSSKTGSTCGSIVSARQQRSKAFTVMTPYGSRKYREPLELSRKTDTTSTRKRHPLIFQDPDEFDKRQNKKTNVAQEDVDENR